MAKLRVSSEVLGGGANRAGTPKGNNNADRQQQNKQKPKQQQQQQQKQQGKKKKAKNSDSEGEEEEEVRPQQKKKSSGPSEKTKAALVISGLLFTAAFFLLTMALTSPEFSFYMLPHLELSPRMTLSHKMINMTMFYLPEAPPWLVGEHGYYFFGRYRRPIAEPTIEHFGFWTKMCQEKAWEFISLSTEKFFFGLAIAQFNYAGHAMGYLYNRETGKFSRFSPTVPLGFGTTVAPSSIGGCSTFNWMGNKLEMCFNRGTGKWHVEGKIKMDDGTEIEPDYSFGVESKEEDTFSMSYPIGFTRPAYTHKAAGLPATGSITVNGVTQKFEKGLALLDYHHGLLSRVTNWFWTALTFKAADGSRVGVQLSTGVYDNLDGHGLENIGFVNGVFHEYNTTVQYQRATRALYGPYEKKGRGDEDRWFIKSTDGSVDLTFKAVGCMPDELSTPLDILDIHLFHTIGHYSGRIEVGGKNYTIANEVGILEDHYARW